MRFRVRDLYQDILINAPMSIEAVIASFFTAGTEAAIATTDRMVFVQGDIRVIVTGQGFTYDGVSGLPLSGEMSAIEVYDQSQPPGSRLLVRYSPSTFLAIDRPFFEAAELGSLLATYRTDPAAAIDQALASVMGDDTVIALRVDGPVTGSNRDERFVSQGAPLELDTGGGNDTIIGSGRDDTLRGGDGDDFLSGNMGDDDLNGGPGNDVLGAHRGADTLEGGAGDDVVGDYQARGQPLGPDDGDILSGGTGNDTLSGGPGGDTLLGGDGDDVLRARGFQQDMLDGGPGNDLLEGFGGDNLMIGGAGHDTLLSFSNDDTLLGGDGNDSLRGGGGNESLDGGLGVDTLRGGPGTDTLFGGDGTDMLQGGTGMDLLRGGSGNDSLFGNAGDDLLYGDAGDDRIDTGPGADWAWGGAGADTFVLRSGDGQIQVSDFDPAEDMLALSRGLWSGASFVSDVDSLIDDVAFVTDGGIVLRFDDGEQVTLADVYDVQSVADAVFLL